MKRNNSYIYPKTIREVIDGKRHYDINDSKLPSVTTILSATQTAEKRESLAKSGRLITFLQNRWYIPSLPIVSMNSPSADG